MELPTLTVEQDREQRAKRALPVFMRLIADHEIRTAAMQDFAKPLEEVTHTDIMHVLGNDAISALLDFEDRRLSQSQVAAKINRKPWKHGGRP